MVGGTWRLSVNDIVIEELGTSDPYTDVVFSPVYLSANDNISLECTSLPDGVSLLVAINVNINDIDGSLETSDPYNISISNIQSGTTFYAQGIFV